MVAVDGIRNRDRRVAYAANPQVFEVFPDDFGDARIVGTGVDPHLTNLSRPCLQRKARVGAADVG
jgi:hypothetical protein